jgi:heat-inducible transcriptional repressor
MRNEELSREEQLRLKQELLMHKAREARFAKTTAKLLSHFSGTLAVSGVPEKEELYDFGMKELLENPEFRELDELCRLVEVLDFIDEKFDLVMRTMRDDETRIFIGEENPIREISNCSMMVTPYRNKEGERGILAIIGPKRMQYAKNKSLLEYVKKLLGSSLVVLIIVL